MRKAAKSPKIRFLGQAAALALLAGGAAGCSGDVTRFGTMFEPTSNQGQIIGSNPYGSDSMATGSLPPPPAQTQPVYRQPQVTSNMLPPAPGATASNAPFVRSDAGASMAALPPAPAPVAAAPAAPRVAGWNGASGTPIVIQPGETIASISRRYGVPETALLTANNLPRGAVVQPGQQIIIPTYSQSAPTVAVVPPSAPVPPAARAVPAKAPAAGGIYVVKPGDSLGRIAVNNGLASSRELAAFNGIDPTAPIKVGQKLKIPAAGEVRTQVAALPTKTMTDAVPEKKPAPVAPPKVADKPAKAPAPAAPQQQARTEPVQPQQPKVSAPQGAGVESASSGNFRWPVRGRVVSGFGVKPSGERNDGINIEVPEGTPIKAAEGGEVIYSGNELKGYGNLVLVKHPSGYVSAYAHASEILVQRGDTVMRGQTIGKVGATGNVSRPQLHFEIRKGNRPVDPLPYLSG